MPAVSQRRKRPSFYRTLPIWAQWVIPFAVAIAVILFLVLWVHHQTNDVPSEAAVTNKGALKEQARENTILEEQIQAPKHAQAKAGAAPAAALKGAITTWLNHQISIGAYGGPLTKESCGTTPLYASSSTRVVMKCEMVTANVTYPFYGVVVPATGKITFCQQDTAPVYGTPDAKFSKSCV